MKMKMNLELELFDTLNEAPAEMGIYLVFGERHNPKNRDIRTALFNPEDRLVGGGFMSFSTGFSDQMGHDEDPAYWAKLPKYPKL